MFAFALALLAASPAPAPSPTPTTTTRQRSILVLDLVASDIPQGAPRLLSGLLTDDVAKRTQMKTLSQEDIRRVVALEADKRDVGCNESSCLAELANAMGVDYVVFGDVGKLGHAYVVTLRLFDPKKAEAIARETVQAEDIDGLRTQLDAAVLHLVAPIAASPPPEPTPSPPASNALLIPGVVVGSIGALAAVGAGIYGASLDSSLGDPKGTSQAKAATLAVEPWIWIGAAGGVAIAVVGAGLAIGGAL